MNFEILYAFVGATAALAISPGPDNIYVLIQSITYGKRFGFATIAGLMSGCFVHTTLVAFGVSALLKQSDVLFWVLKIFGALYLLYLAYRVYLSSSNIDLKTSETKRKSLGELYKQGFIMNVLNPKVSLFFLAFFPGFLFSDRLSNEYQFYILGLIFVIVSFIVFGGIAVLAGNISEYLERYKNSGLYLKWMQIIIFVLIAIFILFSEK